jgi:23S rRNA pseudouridine2604 synthase
MADTPRKPLGLPSKGRSEDDALVNPHRKPLRGGVTNVKRKAGAELAARLPQAERLAPQQKPRGMPSCAPVVSRAASPARSSVGAFVVSKVPQSGERISKLMAERGLCSRREADTYIERGWVFVDGERVTELGTRAGTSATITLDKAARVAQQRQMTILLHKPVGYVSGQPEPGFKPAVTLVLPENQQRTPDTPVFHASHLKGLAPAGRLDIDSTGLLVLTQDGRVARQLIGENSTVDKEYLVRVEGRLDARGLGLLNHGLSLDGRQLKQAKVEWLNEDQLRFILNEGRKRQIRRMCELVGLRVIGLKRVRIGKVKLGDLPLGRWRFLGADEGF